MCTSNRARPAGYLLDELHARLAAADTLQSMDMPLDDEITAHVLGRDGVTPARFTRIQNDPAGASQWSNADPIELHGGDVIDFGGLVVGGELTMASGDSLTIHSQITID